MRLPRQRRRDPGDGAVFQRGDGRWVARLPLPTGGHRFMYGKTKADVRVRLRAAQRAVEDGRPLRDQRLTVGAFLHSWLSGLPSTNVKRSTVAFYHQYVRHHLLTSPLASKPLNRLDAADLRALYAAKVTSGLSTTSVLHLHRVIHRALACAVEDGKVGVNAATLVGRSYRPKAARKEMSTVTEPGRFLAAAHGERLEALLVMAITTGMRQAELRALRWKDVALDRGHVAVVGSLPRADRRADLVISTPKNNKARSVMLSAAAVAALREHRRRQVEEQLLAGAEWKDKGLVFCNEFGDFLPVHAMKAALVRVLERAGLDYVRFHDLRHTAATLLLGQGVHPKVVSEMLGHASIAITLDLYSHVSMSMQKSAAEAMDRLLAQPMVH